jgi:holo-[acyl-carrier protein] synthase
MVKGIGTDITSIERIRDLSQGAISRVLTPQEEAYCRQHTDPFERIAGRFAAKEAIFKALGTGWAQGLGWNQIEILPDSLGAPQATLTGPAANRMATIGATRCFISISHEKLFAVAFAVLE